METRLPWRPTRGSLTSPSHLVRNRTLHQMYFYPEHPMYRLVDDVLTAVSQMAYEAQVAASTAQATADAARADFRRVVRIDNDGLHVGDNQSTGEEIGRAHV